MACSKAETGVVVPRAVLSCFVKHNETVYIVLCKHARNAAKCDFFVKDQTGKEFPIGQKLNRETSSSETYNEYDIDIIKVYKDKVHLCTSVFRNRNGEVQNRVRIFSGSASDLFGNTVFMCVKTGTGNGFTVRSGNVLTCTEIDDVYRPYYCMETHFFVRNKDGNTFAIAGDSGRIVARETEDGYLELIGIVVQKTNGCTICLLLKNGLEFLNQAYNFQLSLLDSLDRPNEASDNLAVEPGETLTFIRNQE